MSFVSFDRKKKAEIYLKELMEREINKGELPGMSIGLVKDGKLIYTGNFGYANIEKQKKVQSNTLFRLYSMSKPVTAIVSMIFWERGLFDIYEPLSKYLPEFKNVYVWENGKKVPAKREILIKDLLNMTSGIVYPDSDLAGSEMDQIFSKEQEMILLGKGSTTRNLIRETAKCGLAHHPGEHWRYGFSCDVMGAVLEVIAGKKLSEIYKEELFEPLDMNDTGFYVPKSKKDRFAELYTYYEEEERHGLHPEEKRHLCLTKCLEAPMFESAGAGLISSVQDYWKFAALIAGKGKYGDLRMLSEKTIEYLQYNQLTGQQLIDKECDHMQGYGYGNFMRVYMDHPQSGSVGTIGEIGWDGWTGTYFIANPYNNEAIIFMTQRCEYVNPSLIRKMRNIVQVMFE
jgi:CubicO group peptidase (beta-lactamase class C family)